MNNLKLSHTIIPRTSMNWSQWFWYTDANEDPNVTITKKYLTMENENDNHEDTSWNEAVFIGFAIGSLVLIGFCTILAILIPYLMYEQ